MEIVQIGDWKLCVDVPKTKAFYARMDIQNDRLPWLNYIELGSFIELEVQAFFDLFGIDLLKPSQLSCHPVEGGSNMMYTGSYHLYGECLQGEMDGWDLIIGNYCFSLTEEMEAMPGEASGNMTEISFEVVLPWMLELPITST